MGFIVIDDIGGPRILSTDRFSYRSDIHQITAVRGKLPVFCGKTVNYSIRLQSVAARLSRMPEEGHPVRNRVKVLTSFILTPYPAVAPRFYTLPVNKEDSSCFKGKWTFAKV